MLSVPMDIKYLAVIASPVPQRVLTRPSDCRGGHGNNVRLLFSLSLSSCRPFALRVA